MNRTCLLLFCFSLFCVPLFACSRAERSPPLPGDSVSSDGAVSLATPRLSTVATPGAPREQLSAIEVRLFPAELVMEHKSDISLTRAQQDALTKELDRSQSELVKLQWDLQSEKDKLVKVLDDAKVDEARSRQAAEALMQRENAIKAVHLSLLVRIKNILTPDQQEKLRALRESERCAPATTRDGGRD